MKKSTVAKLKASNETPVTAAFSPEDKHLAPSVNITPVRELPRLAFSLKETAQMLGVSYISIYRLVARGKLKSTGGLRHKLITQTEINRFLSE